MIKTIKKDIDRALTGFLERIGSRLSAADSAEPLYRCIRDFVLRDGKRVRPILFILAYTGYTREKIRDMEPVYNASLSVELLHDFLLVHDDIIDRSPLRRGGPSMHRLFNTFYKKPPDSPLGNDLATVAGDIIFGLSVETLLAIEEKAENRAKALRIFLESTVDTGVGEYIDIVNNFRGIDRIPLEEVLLTYRYKTSKYTFQCPLKMGAVLAGAEDDELERLSALSISLGQAFQIQDDLLDVFSSQEKTGKPVLSDIAEGKKTLLMWHAFSELDNTGREQLSSLLDLETKTDPDIEKIASLVRSTEAGARCFSRMNELFEETLSLCGALRMNTEQLRAFETFVRSLIKRNDLIDL
ncbi:MAG: hypothetical protein GF392_04135 [Candidatus Omnitrophica bacterium]|nr:hypothetical protein [Candidatus Omnitrophota bacterium]